MKSSYLRLINAIGLSNGLLSLHYDVLSRVNLNAKSKVLYFGSCVDEKVFFIAKNYRCKVQIITDSNHSVNKAKLIYGDEPYIKNIKFINNDLINIKKSSFDLVIIDSMLLFIKNKAETLAIINNLIKPKGCILLMELCLQNGDNKDISNFFAQEEIKAFIPQSIFYTKYFHDFAVKIMDEKPFNFIDKRLLNLKLDFQSLTQVLEAGFSIALDDSLRKDFFSLIAIVKYLPKNILKELFMLTMLVKKV